MAQIEWDEGCHILVRAAREISRDLGHHETICPLHLLLALLIKVRPLSMAPAEPNWNAVEKVMREFAPPWGDVAVLSPGGQTPATKRVLREAIDLAAEAKKPVDIEYVWLALRGCEGNLVLAVFRELGLAGEGERAESFSRGSHTMTTENRVPKSP